MHEQQQMQQQKSEIFNISKLLDNYLAEIARDPNLSIAKFQVLAELQPNNSRSCDDGLYRAIDTYLKVIFSFLSHVSSCMFLGLARGILKQYSEILISRFSLQTHPAMTDHDRRRLCKIMNCDKLSLDACMHAAQNDRLPLRTVVQVRFFQILNPKFSISLASYMTD